MEPLEADHEWMKGQGEAARFINAFVDSLVLKCAVELRIADIIHSHGGPITLSQIASSIDSTSPDISYLTRIMRLLVRKKVFTVDYPSDGGDALYGLTPVSRWLLNDSDWSLAPMSLMVNHPWIMAPWHCFSQCVKEGGSAFKKAHGMEIWELASKNPEFNKIFNDGMACTTRMVTRGIVKWYRDGFSCMRSLVDVGGGTGGLVAQIVKAYPHIKGINFDLPHVVATAPDHEGVSHIAGDMFVAIPNADAVIMKWIMHDWKDEDCVKILKNCQRAIPAKSGKIIIVEMVLQQDGDGLFDEGGLVFDLMMMANSSGGKERTELEWKTLLEKAGFPRYKIIEIPSFLCIIEAYPE